MTWLIAAFFYAYQYILRVIPNIMINDIMLTFNIDAALFGQFSGVYYLGYALAHVPVGLMLDRLGPKKILPTFILITVLGTTPLIITDFWLFPVIGRFIVGVGSSSAILGVLKIIHLSFSERHFAIMLSWSVTVGLLGAIYGGAPINYFQDLYGFKYVIFMLLIAGIILALIAYFVLPDLKTKDQKLPFWHNVKAIISNKKVIIICLLAGFMVGPLEGFADVWGSTFLEIVYGLDNTLQTSLPSFIFIGMALGAPLLSLIASRFKNNVIIIAICGFLMCLIFIVILNFLLPSSALFLLFFTIGFMCAYQILAIQTAVSFSKKNMAALTSAVANMIIMTFGYIFHSSIGGIVDSFSKNEGYAPLDSKKALTYGLLIIPLGLFIGAIGFLIFYYNEQRTKNKHP